MPLNKKKLVFYKVLLRIKLFQTFEISIFKNLTNCFNQKPVPASPLSSRLSEIYSDINQFCVNIGQFKFYLMFMSITQFFSLLSNFSKKSKSMITYFFKLKKCIKEL